MFHVHAITGNCSKNEAYASRFFAFMRVSLLAAFNIRSILNKLTVEKFDELYKCA